MVSFGETPEQYFALFALRQYASEASQARFYCSRQEPYFYDMVINTYCGQALTRPSIVISSHIPCTSKVLIYSNFK